MTGVLLNVNAMHFLDQLLQVVEFPENSIVILGQFWFNFIFPIRVHLELVKD